MCTVAFIPSAGRYFFASLRDENPARPKAEAPLLYEEDAVRFLAPKDPKAGGTWAGINRYENVIILLNGGFENHESTGQYRKSRGLIVNELLKSVYPVVEWSVMDMEGIEPYTLIIWSENNLFQLVWDGRNKHRLLLDPQQPAIWSSSTLYNTQAKEKRKSLFDSWVSGQPSINPESMMNFFQSFQDEENGFLMQRTAMLKTLSYSFIELSPGNHGIYYYDDFSKSGPETKQISTAGYTPDLSVLFSNQDLLQRKK